VKLPIALVALALVPAAAGGKVTFVQNGFFTHPGDKGRWEVTGAISDRGTFVRVCVKCTSGRAVLRGTYRSKRGTFVLLAYIALPAPDQWTLLSGTGFYKGMHGKGTCLGRVIVNEVSFRDHCVGLMVR
jgi:hypothetical protein